MCLSPPGAPSHTLSPTAVLAKRPSARRSRTPRLASPRISRYVAPASVLARAATSSADFAPPARMSGMSSLHAAATACMAQWPVRSWKRTCSVEVSGALRASVSMEVGMTAEDNKVASMLQVPGRYDQGGSHGENESAGDDRGSRHGDRPALL